MKKGFRCPVCGNLLTEDERTYRCPDNHCFDKAKQGYVNLLRSQKSSKKRHGDDSLMVKARQDFLEKGYYNDLCEKIIEAVLKYSDDEVAIADLGCGECWYTAQLYNSLVEKEKDPQIFGIDISKQALISGAKRCKNLKLAVASTSDIPLADESCDIVVCIFAPYSESQVYRVLKTGGVFIKAFPLENHLMGLKQAVYDKPYKNEVSTEIGDGFEILELIKTENVITLESGEDIANLFKMTPYYYKTSLNDQMKIQKLNYLQTQTEFGIAVYKKA